MSRTDRQKVRWFNRAWRRITPVHNEHLLVEGDEVIDVAGAIGEHLPALYWELMRQQPRVVVEIGTREGESTRVVTDAGRRFNSLIVSIDVAQTVFSTDYDGWVFVRGPGQEMVETFRSIAVRRDFRPEVDFWFLDSSHEYEETRAELEAWMPLWSERVALAFHDTNMASVYRRSDGSLGLGWNNNEGVTEAIRDCLGVDIPPKRKCVFLRGEWLVRHNPYSSGFTLLQRI